MWHWYMKKEFIYSKAVFLGKFKLEYFFLVRVTHILQ